MQAWVSIGPLVKGDVFLSFYHFSGFLDNTKCSYDPVLLPE